MNKYCKKENETEYEYGLRLIKIKNEEKPDDLEWGDIVELLGLNVHRDTLRKSAVATSPYSGYSVMKYFEEKYKNEDKKIEEKSGELYELKQLKVQIQDEKNELNKKIREMARNNNLIETFRNIISEDVKPWERRIPYPDHLLTTLDSDKNELLVTLSDLHYGIVNDNYYNKYNPRIAEKRIAKYITEVLKIKSIYNSSVCTIFLGGDLISGQIHTTLRIENAIGVFEQIKQVSRLISIFVQTLAENFEKVRVFHVPGNHSRAFPKKSENQHGDYLDSLIPFYVQAKLQNYKNVEIYMDNKYDDEICTFEVKGHKIAAVHGHHDQVSNVLNNVVRMTGEVPEMILMGHRHSNGLTTVDRTKIVESGSLSGMDSYCIENRLVGNPEQVVLVISENNLIKAYCDVTLK